MPLSAVPAGESRCGRGQGEGGDEEVGEGRVWQVETYHR